MVVYEGLGGSLFRLEGIRRRPSRIPILCLKLSNSNTCSTQHTWLCVMEPTIIVIMC